ncbi:hypothetical protein GCK72_005291 [Caenorhabditis remanei]|uniref:Uncharacterized protein n=1 Tax=Caenorhabditis remanei TaxID=31234 RepID=A0A6A5HE50_CAERE|nr:hypothetical protein GCK72_005291 [Caenorhabditis remanei]KAF1765339.1 hypothetical protein GCK72_005291 [Caenorhabditis remanei]
MDPGTSSPIHRSMPPESRGISLSELENRIQNLVDGQQRDDVKLRMLQEIWVAIENHFTSHTHAKVVEKLILSFLALFCNTSPQFISENNTQMLRKLMLEIILRLSNVEAVKVHSKEIIKQMMRLIAVENEENAIIAIKIVQDQGRNSGKMQYCAEVQSIMQTFKTMVADLTASGRSKEMFLNREMTTPPQTSSDEQLITEYLKTCYYAQQVNLNGKDPKKPVKYSLIPSAHQSTKVLNEIPYLIIFFYQHFKTAIQTEALEFMRLGFEFLNVPIPADKQRVNEALCDDFVSAQSRLLSFVNIMAKIPAFMDMIQQNGEALVSGTMQMLEFCPPDLISVRREVLMALKYFTSGEMKSKFFPMLPRLISEHVVLGTGFTAIEHLRVFMYQMLADLLHHMRSKINYEMITHVVFVFCRTLHDPNNSSQVQIMSARLLNSLAESLSKMDAHDATRDLLIEILETNVAKLKILAVYHMPILFQQYGTEIDYEYKSYERDTEKPGINIPKETIRGVPKRRLRKLSIDSVEELELATTSSVPKKPENQLPTPTKENTKKTSPEDILTNMCALTPPPLPIGDARTLIKYIMHTCKFVTAQLRTSRPAKDMYHCAKERDLFERLLRYGVMCMDVFVLPQTRNQPQSHSSMRTKDEKDALESLANVFTTIDHAVFREIFDKYMDFLIERIYNRNYPLQLMVNTFLVRNEVPFFASTMLSFLMSRMKLLEVSNDKTTLYVKLFKIIFSAIGANNSGLHTDKMLTSYLPEILKQSTVLALTAREPLNYFLLLRALFRSIGGGAQDILYGKFLQLLPNLLQFLNKLTSCQHRIQMRELFVELCLTVPVRLSSLLPYLPLLMDPLVCAMNGSPNIVTQGLRTLELCVDNLQPEYLLENMMPVRGALMQGLYRVVAKAPDAASMTVAFRLLGKFGGANRRLLNQPQILQFSRHPDSFVNMEFSNLGLDGPHSIHLPLSELMRVAADQMRYPADQILNMNATNIPSTQMKKWCMELSKAVLFAGFGSSGSTVVPDKQLPKILKKLLAEFDVNNRTTKQYTCIKENDRELFVNALLTMAYGIWNKDGFRHTYNKFFNSVVRQFALIGVIEYVGGNDWMADADINLSLCLDSSVLVDALIICLSETTTGFLYAGITVLRLINDVMTLALPDVNLMSKVPLCRYLMEKVFKLCHGPSWFARCGGIQALSCMIEHFPRKFVMDFVIDVVDSIIEVILGVVEEISSGAAESAFDCLETMMCVYFIGNEGEEESNLTLASIFIASISKHYFHSNEKVREYMARLMDRCLTFSRLAPDREKFYYRFKSYFEPELIRILTTLPTMSLTDASGSLDSLQSFMFICPDGFEFETDTNLYRRYLVHLLDIAQTDTHTINQRNGFKKCETCPSHFLPPFPITYHIDSMRASAFQCLVIAYDRLRKQLDTSKDIQGEQVMSEILALSSPKITVDQIFENNESWRRLMTVLLRADTDKEVPPEIAEKVHEALMKIAPIPTNIIATFGANIIRNISRVHDDNDSDRTISYHDIRKFSILVELNPRILVKNMALNLANQMIQYKMNEKIAKTFVLPVGTPEAEVEEFEAEKKKGIRELDKIAFTAKMLAGCPMPIITEEIIIDIARFAAHFEYTYSQDVLVNWMDDVALILNKSPIDVWQFFLSPESINDPARRSLIRRIIIFPASEPLREEFMDNKDYLTRLIDADGIYFKNDDTVKICAREMFALSLVDRISKISPEWLSSELSPILELKNFFKSKEFNERYSVRTITEDTDDKHEIRVISMTEDKYKVPKLCAKILIRYLRDNIKEYDTFFDLVSVFMGRFQTDFSFVREFFEVEVIPKMPLWWRREIFIHVMVLFEDCPKKVERDLRMVKALQYLVIPSLQWAFERYDSDEIVGAAPIDDTESSLDADSSANKDNLVARLTSVIQAHRLNLSDGMIIVFYQMCTLFVQHAAEHIHNNNCKKQGGRLRILMLFAWPCLQSPNRQDPTMRYTGFFFLANIIERFTINRKIVLQVFNQLMTTFQQDTRDQVRRAIDILTPALRLRMEDGHTQICNHVKKILIEESHCLQHIQHMFHMIVRNYRVYYHIRNDLLTALLSAVQRALLMPNSAADNWQTRRQALEICEVIVKWEMFKFQKQDHVITDEEALEVDRQYELLRSASTSALLDFEDPQSKRDIPDAQRVIKQEHADTVVNMLMRFCMTFHQSHLAFMSNQPQGGALVKSCQILLRVALRSSIWGDYVNIHVNSIEKCLHVPLELAPKPNEIQSIPLALALSSSQYSMEMLIVIIPVMPKHTLMAMMEPLQRALCICLNSSQIVHQGQILRYITQIVSRLCEKTAVSATGFDELGILNQHIFKFLQDSFMAIGKNPASPMMSVVGSFSLARAICAHEPSYLDTVMVPFLKVMIRATKEHLSYVAAGQQGPIVKNIAELLSVCMDLMRRRTKSIALDTKKSMVNDIVAELIYKSSSDKILQASVKLLGALLSVEDMDFTLNTLLPHIADIQSKIVQKFKTSKDLIADFLVVVLQVFANNEWRTSEHGSLLWEGFFWGLKSGDPQTRENFSIVWEQTWPHMATVDLRHRMKYILQDQDWSRFKHTYWLKFALWAVLRTISKRPTDSNTQKKKVVMLSCATPWRTIEYAARLNQQQSMEVDEPVKLEEPEPMEVDETRPENVDDAKENETLTLDRLLEEQQNLLEEASQFDFADVLDTVSQITFGLSDNSITSKIWIEFFKSFWDSLDSSEIQGFKDMVIPFMSSGVHNCYQTGNQDSSVLAVWLEAVGEKVTLPSRLIEFISTKHECWHTGIKLLEDVIWAIPKQLNNHYLGDLNCDPALIENVETLESLASIYNEISEFDQLATVWERRAVFQETLRAMSAMQLGDMEGAASILEVAMCKEAEKVSSHTDNHITPVYDKEYDHWMDMYVSSCSELLQWHTVADVCNSRDMQNVRGLINAASHIPDWNVVEECKNQIAGCIPPDFHLDYTIYNLMCTVMKMDDRTSMTEAKKECKRVLNECIDAHISKWRALPSYVSYGHVKLLQSMNLIRDIEESTEIRLALIEPPSRVDTGLMQDMKTLMKAYRNRAPTTADEMGFVSTWYDWRNQIHGMMLQRFEWFDKSGFNNTGNGNQSIVPTHSMAQAQINVARHAKNLGFYNLTKDLLNKLSGLTTIPMMDSIDKVCTYGKTLREMAMSTEDEKLKNELLNEALEVLEDVRIDDFQKEQVARLYYHRANIHSVLGQTQVADKTFSAAIQLIDMQTSSNPTGVKLMRNWGHHLNKLFFQSPVCKETSENYGRQALVCYFVAARVENDIKARKPIARIMWLAKHLSACGADETLNRVIKKQLHSLNLFNWLYWLPQLVTAVRHQPKSNFVFILCRMAAAHPLQTFYHICEAVSVEDIDAVLREDYTEEEMSMDVSDDEAFANDPPFARILKICLKYRPTDIRVFHRIMKELDEMNETWTERHLRFALGLKAQLFDDFAEQMDANFQTVRISDTAHSLIQTWKKQLEEDFQYFEENYNLDFLEIRAKRKCTVTKGYMGDEKSQIMFEKELTQVFTDPLDNIDELTFVTNQTREIIPELDIRSLQSNNPRAFCGKVLEWIRKIRYRFEILPKRIPLESSSPFLARFSHRTSCIEMPYDLFNVIRAKNPTLMATNQTGQYISMLSRFEPNFEVTVKSGQVMRKIYLRGQTGKSAAFYLKKSVQDEKTNRVPQLFKHMDHLLQNDREAAKRHLHVPTFLQMRVGKRTTLYEIASVQPYAMPHDCARNYPASQIEIVHPYDVFSNTFNGLFSPDDMVLHYFERFAAMADKIGTPLDDFMAPQDNRPTSKKVEIHHLQHYIYNDLIRDITPFRTLTMHLSAQYTDPVMYYAMRKQFVHSFAVLSTIEYHCNLTPMGLHQMLITLNTGVLTNPWYRFELGKKPALPEIEHFAHEVPFRLTPNLSILIGVAQDGDLLWSMAAAAKCLMKKEPEVVMRSLLWDEYANNVDSTDMIYVCHATNSYVNCFENKVAMTHRPDAKIKKDDCISLIIRAKDVDNLSRMPPTYQPWF